MTIMEDCPVPSDARRSFKHPSGISPWYALFLLNNREQLSRPGFGKEYELEVLDALHIKTMSDYYALKPEANIHDICGGTSG